ncbi:MAG: arginine deiminase family protein [Planctomycetota bacterium]|nr:arginine deiminase family protein [Planctomycetota bacterium]
MPSTLHNNWRTEVPHTPHPKGVLMCPPDHFQVVDIKNDFMKGQVGLVDPVRAKEEWGNLVDAFQEQNIHVHVLTPVPNLEDLVFTANPACIIPRETDGADSILSRMRHDTRQAEVTVVANWLEQHNIRTHTLPEGTGYLEGHGDILIIPGRRAALAGYGGRSDLSAIHALSDAMQLPIHPVPLKGKPFYHLDTCMAVLNEDTLLIHEEAFAHGEREALSALFPRILDADPDEAATVFACNVHALANGNVIVPAQATATASVMSDAGFTPIPVDVSEFHRSGGSVFCLRLDLPGKL